MKRWIIMLIMCFGAISNNAEAKFPRHSVKTGKTVVKKAPPTIVTKRPVPMVNRKNTMKYNKGTVVKK